MRYLYDYKRKCVERYRKGEWSKTPDDIQTQNFSFELNKVSLVASKNKKLKDKIKNIFEQNKHRYGVRRIYQEFVNRGCHVNHKRVQRLMHCMGKRPKEKYHSYKGAVGRIAPNIIDRDFKHDCAIVEVGYGHITIKFHLGEMLYFTDSGYAYQ
ncbi:MAG: IS3 family transposase [Eubacteriaceae bacterium]|nr:IS3 family transposase [Eubacteriaceae bacterium]